MKMTKKKSTILFIISLACIIILGLISGIGIGKTKTGSAERIKLGLDLQGGVSITYQVADKEFTAEELADTVYKLQKRVANYSTEANVYTEGTNRITVDIPGETDISSVLQDLGNPGTLQFITYTGVEDNPDTAENEAVKVWLSGSDIKNAQAGTRKNSTSGAAEYVVQLTMTDEGSAKFEEATTQNVGQIIYILYDNSIVSAPRVNSAISGGEAVIEGMANYDEADHLASTIRIGSLKLSLEELSSKVVSAKLGEDAVSTSLLGGIIGLLVVMAFMISVYRIPGVAASIALALYTIMMLLVMNAFDLTLSLSGIAGIILSIGMAVDANVIVYARIREEIAAGRSLHEAIKIGFKKASSAIIDGNVTTFAIAIILILRGSGSVQGFGQTLAIGIVLSMFTAMAASRFLMYMFYHMGFRKESYYGKYKERKAFDFIKIKKITFPIAAICAAAGLVIMIVFSATGKSELNYSVEFKGGTSTTVEFAQDYSINEFNNTIKPVIAEIINDNDIQGQKVNQSNKYEIKTKAVSPALRDEIKSVLVDKFGALPDSFETVFISSSISTEMTRDAIVAVVLALIFMLFYIWFRFRDIRFAASGIIALVHDILVVVTFYALFRASVGNNFIACLLTILGYSINASIVIFDRIRENVKKPEYKNNLYECVNASITQTLTRSIYTTFTTFIVLFVLYIFGVVAIREFALPLIVGILAGVYSDVFISGPLYYLFAKNKKENKK
ncbi:protein translocase subunit SecD [Parasporobacterium paucivorans]|uniref:Multifunctional fusion protein n=1 Tax=Parasporobacterium paucivorans DSM 15970 TaxID=1122934 RepID=A0A1M6AKA5_9FIRM|nr:protein translocase subunit SecD [Parasporobacterium paucivorans]SHI36847.1 SecD/SecF fusion protein [Parasporobacterium paucivorans DSM 15970]